MSNDDANQRCMICRAIGFVIAAILVGLITWWLFGKVAAWLAILAFLGLFAFGLWLVLKFCGEPVSYAAGATAGAGLAAAGAAAASSQSGSADADAAAAKAKADADAAAARAKADADADAKAKREADEAAARKQADVDAAKAEADASAERARRKAEEDAARAQAEAQAAKTSTTPTAADEADRNAIGDLDGDGVLEGTDEGSRPAGLDGPRGGTADDLKRIKGVGPKMEKLCNSLGFYHFDQIAGWSTDEIAWVDANLEGFKGRVTRDTWVAQAKLLATGGETEFSKKVDDGDVY